MSSEERELPIEDIIPDPNQPRKCIDDQKLRELAESIKQVGLLQPVLVRPLGDGKYMLVHGERRFRACKSIGLPRIKAEVRDLSDKEVLEIQLIENLQREDLNPIEEAQAYKRMIDELGYTHEILAKKIGKSREYVTNKLRLLDLPDDIQEEVKRDLITESHARAMLSLGPNQQRQVAKKVLKEHWSVKKTEELIHNLKGRENVSRETSSIPKYGRVVGVWLSNKACSSLEALAKSRGIGLEKLCSKILEEEALNAGKNERMENES